MPIYDPHLVPLSVNSCTKVLPEHNSLFPAFFRTEFSSLTWPALIHGPRGIGENWSGDYISDSDKSDLFPSHTVDNYVPLNCPVLTPNKPRVFFLHCRVVSKIEQV